MYIESIDKITKIKYKVSTDKGLLYLYTGDLRRYRLKSGEEVPDEVYDALMKETLIPRCRKKALDILTRADRTRKELVNRLKRAGFTEELIDDAIAYVDKYHYINDERVAASYIAFKGGRKSSRELASVLKNKGVDKETAERLIEAYGDDDEAIEAAIRKKTLGKTVLSDDELRKLNAYLFRHGFDGELIRDKLAKFRENV